MVRGIPLTRRHLMLAMGGSGAMLLGKPRFALAQDSSVLRVRSYGDLQVMDPAFRLSGPDGDVMRAIYTGLVVFKPGDEWTWEFDGAAMINQLDDTHIEFKLREGIMYSNGFGEMTAEDVRFSYMRYKDAELNAPYKDDWAPLVDVEVKDKYNGVIVLDKPFAPLWNSTLPTESGIVIPKAAFDKVGGKIGMDIPCTSGPYLFKEWLPKQKTTLVKNPDWNGTPVDFDEIQIFPIEDPKTAELGFEAGDIDFTWIATSSIKRLLETPPADGQLVVKSSLAYTWIGMNVEAAPFDNAKVRRAVQHAIDVKAVLDITYQGGAEPATGIIAPGLPGNRAANIYGYDPEKAKALLAEAGFPDGFDCTIDTLNTTEYNTVCTVVQAQLAEVGIRVQIKSSDSGIFWTLGDQSVGDAYKSVQLILNRFTMLPDPSWATLWFTTDQIGIWNWERWSNKEFDNLNAAAVGELDVAKRDEMYKKMQDMMEESGAYVFLTHGSQGVVYRNTLTPALMPNGVVVLPMMKKA